MPARVAAAPHPPVTLAVQGLHNHTHPTHSTLPVVGRVPAPHHHSLSLSLSLSAPPSLSPSFSNLTISGPLALPRMCVCVCVCVSFPSRSRGPRTPVKGLLPGQPARQWGEGTLGRLQGAPHGRGDNQIQWRPCRVCLYQASSVSFYVSFF